ncbi:MAG: hypothetical protein AB8G17_21580 [Gammaproteobacteria bacterium]
MLIAMLVAPLLAVIAWLATNALVTPRPQAARSGDAYPLRALSNCRYRSGVCDLRNGDVQLTVTREVDGVWRLVSSQALDGGLLSIGATDAPRDCEPLNDTRQLWHCASGTRELDATAVARIVVALGGAHYFAETSLTFAMSE